MSSPYSSAPDERTTVPVKRDSGTRHIIEGRGKNVIYGAPLRRNFWYSPAFAGSVVRYVEIGVPTNTGAAGALRTLLRARRANCVWGGRRRSPFSGRTRGLNGKTTRARRARIVFISFSAGGPFVVLAQMAVQAERRRGLVGNGPSVIRTKAERERREISSNRSDKANRILRHTLPVYTRHSRRRLLYAADTRRCLGPRRQSISATVKRIHSCSRRTYRDGT